MIKFNEHWMHFVNLSLRLRSLCHQRLECFSILLIFCRLITPIHIFMVVKFQYMYHLRISKWVFYDNPSSSFLKLLSVVVAFLHDYRTGNLKKKLLINS